MYDKSCNSDIIIDNLKMLLLRSQTINDLTASQIKEFIAFEIIPRIQNMHSPTAIISNTLNVTQKISDKLTSEHKITICKHIVDFCTNNNIDLWELICRTDNVTLNSSIAYVNNRFSKKAYSIFKGHIQNTKGNVYQSFNEMYDAVESGLCNCCIVPIENTTDGKLLAFYALIERFDMKISMVCDIEAEDGSERTRYALLKYHLFKPNDIYDTIYFEFSYSSSNGIEFSEIIESAVLCNLTVSRIDSLPLIHNDSNFIMHTVVCGKPSDVLNYLIYLSINLPQFNTLALYPIVK